MRWKITGRFLASTIAIVVIVLIVNTLLGIGMLLYESKQTATQYGPEDFTRRFADNITIQNGRVTLPKEAKAQLDDQKSFFQVLDRNGKQMYAYNTPKALPTNYTPTMLIQYYKYQELPNTTIFFGEKDGYSYLIGMENTQYDRYVFSADMHTMLLKAGRYLLIFLLADVLIALLIGIVFGNMLTKPMHTLIDGIRTLRERKFSAIPMKQKGAYKEVFVNMNALATTLEAYEQAQKQNEKMRDEWISNISHDMKTPLASIQGYAELMQYADSPEEIAEYSAIIEAKSKYMRTLLDDLNLTMKLRNNALPLNLEMTNIVSFSREVAIDVLNDAEREHHLTFTPHVENLSIHIDQKLMKRALLNFIYNAFIHNDDDVAVTFDIYDSYPQHVAIHDEKLSTASCCIVIQDNGRGIKAADLENIFERYYRGTNTTNTKGTGLGTAIARDIIEAHDGRVHLMSEVDVGTTIIIALP